MNKLFLASILLLFACAGDSPSDSQKATSSLNLKLFTKISPSESGITFVNKITENEEINHMVWDACYYGGGVAMGDVNNDGLPDLFFTGNQVPDALFLNLGDWKFKDISEESGITQNLGWSNGVSMVDYDGDGLLDIYVCRSAWLGDSEMVEERRNVLWKNLGNAKFENVAPQLGLDNEGFSTQSAWLDYDADGDLDMFLLNAPSNNIPQKVKYSQSGFPDFVSDKLFRNDGTHFSDVSEEAGVHAFSFGLGVVATDLNHDGKTDLYVANDYERPDYFYINQGNGHFSDELSTKIKHTCFTAMGVDAGDINNDALIDFAVLDMQASSHYRSKTNMPSMRPEQFWKWVGLGYNYQYMTNVLQVNNGVGYFSDVSQIAGMASTDWSWSVLLADLDLDGWKDIFVTNGINRDIQNNDFAREFEDRMKRGEKLDLLEMAAKAPSTKISNFAFKNGSQFNFESVAHDWGLGEPSFSYGAALGDLDGDGDLDLVVNNNNMPPFVFRNNAHHNWLMVSVQGMPGNSQGIGSKVALFTKGRKQFVEITNTRGYQSSSVPVAHFGLGDDTTVDSLVVFFPDGKVVKRYKVKANEKLEISYRQARMQPFKVYGDIAPIFSEWTDALNFDFEHIEDEFDDFAREILLPHRQSRLGPALAVGDVNGDGLEDAFFGGAAGQSGALLIQNENATFDRVVSPFADAEWVRNEEVDAVIFDFDGDGDNDIYCVVGGAHLPLGDSNYRDVVYVNEGGLKFHVERVEGSNSNGSCVALCDFDGDGDVDLFIGAKGIPGKYPNADRSCFLVNENGVFVDKTLEICPELQDLGMVTDAVWADFNRDELLDLVVVGEWMAPRFFENKGSVLSPSSFNDSVDSLRGWFYEIEPADLDGDGDMDFVLGNVGLNNKFHPSHKNPLKIYGNDFDHNNTNDVVLAKCSGDQYVPVRGRECSSEQMPFVAKKFEDYESYATATIEDIYGEGLAKATFLSATDFRSGILVNTGRGFEFVPLPNLAQASAIHGVVVEDFNRDGHADLLLAGNLFDTEVETTRYDASNGLLLLGKGDFSFETQNALYSGFYAPGNVKQLERINLANGKLGVIVGNNNGKSVLFSRD